MERVARLYRDRNAHRGERRRLSFVVFIMRGKEGLLGFGPLRRRKLCGPILVKNGA